MCVYLYFCVVKPRTINFPFEWVIFFFNFQKSLASVLPKKQQKKLSKQLRRVFFSFCTILELARQVGFSFSLLQSKQLTSVFSVGLTAQQQQFAQQRYFFFSFLKNLSQGKKLCRCVCVFFFSVVCEFVAFIFHKKEWRSIFFCEC